MNKVVLQLWEESNEDGGFLNNGCSIHLDSEERKKYVESIYSNRDESIVPFVYDKIIGKGINVYIDDNLYKIILNEKSIKLSQIEFVNMLKFDEIIYNESEI